MIPAPIKNFFSEIYRIIPAPSTFAASSLIFVFNALIPLVFLLQNFKNNFDSYPLLFAIGGFFALIKEFIIGYHNIMVSINQKRWFLGIFNLIFSAAAFGLIYLAIETMTRDSYPRVTVGCLLIAAIIFHVQAFTVNHLTSLRGSSLVLIIMYIVSFGLLYQNDLINYNENVNLFSLSIFAVVALIGEAILMLGLTREHINSMHAQSGVKEA